MKKNLFFVTLFVLGFVFFPYQSGALTISPAKIIISADPGETIETKMTVRNDLPRLQTLFPTFEGYTTRGGEEPVFFETDRDLPTWIETIPSEVTLGEKEQTNITVRIRVPEDAEPGGHYAAIFWSSVAPGSEGTGVSIVTKVGALVLLDVSGTVVESGNLSEFKAPAKFFTHLPIGFIYQLENTGTVHLLPAGKLIIKNIFGRTSAVLETNPAQSYVLPQTTRTFYAQNWEPEGGIPKIEGEGIVEDFKRELKGFAFGYYRANLALEYGKQEIQTAKASFGFWVIPWHVLTLSTLIFALLLLGIINGIKRYNQWVINKVEERIRNQDKIKKKWRKNG